MTPAAVPGKLYLDHLQPLAGKAAPVGTLQEPDLEKLAAVGPDLIGRIVRHPYEIPVGTVLG
ncbi:MAG TPA: hypothetical protein PLL33_04920 [Paracoccus sp. (in: a-proteobacteria)]|nr:hypothetical protein [Paracoccus sp. (in: a-proteobacteria)]